MGGADVVFSLLYNATGAGNRVYPQVLPQGAVLPAISYQQVSAVRTHAMGQDGQITRVRMQVNAWGKTYADARALAGQVLTQLSRFKGTTGGVQVLDVLLDNELDQYEDTSQTRRVIQDYTLFLVTN